MKRIIFFSLFFIHVLAAGHNGFATEIINDYNGTDNDTINQDDINNHKNFFYRKSGISLCFLSSGFTYGVSYDHFLARNVNLQFTLGVGSVSGGLKLYPWINNDRRSPIQGYIGIDAIFLYDFVFNYKWYDFLYIPVGIQLFSKKTFTASLEVGYLRDLQDKKGYPFGGLKLGYRFKNKTRTTAVKNNN